MSPGGRLLRRQVSRRQSVTLDTYYGVSLVTWPGGPARVTSCLDLHHIQRQSTSGQLLLTPSQLAVKDAMPLPLVAVPKESTTPPVSADVWPSRPVEVSRPVRPPELEPKPEPKPEPELSHVYIDSLGRLGHVDPVERAK